jgi:hypothetical protein
MPSQWLHLMRSYPLGIPHTLQPLKFNPDATLQSIANMMHFPSDEFQKWEQFFASDYKLPSCSYLALPEDLFNFDKVT